MSRSFHVTYKSKIKMLSVREIIEQAADPNSNFSQWSKKITIKDAVPRQRKQTKWKNN